MEAGFKKEHSKKGERISSESERKKRGSTDGECRKYEAAASSVDLPACLPAPSL